MDLNAGQLTRWIYSGSMQWTNGAYEESWIFVGTTLSEMPTSVALPTSHHFHPSVCLVFGRLARMDENVDASQAIFKPPPEIWRQPPGWPRTTWMKNIHDDLSLLDLGARDKSLEIWRKIGLFGD